jgi:hypothetical protein
MLSQNLVRALAKTIALIPGPTANYHNSLGLEISSLSIPLTSSSIFTEFVIGLRKDRLRVHFVQRSIL